MPPKGCTDQKAFALSAGGTAQGWQWLDEDWHIDMTGHEDACVDNEGWCYAVDFNWLRHPPAPGSGRFRRVRAPWQPSPTCASSMPAMNDDLS